MECLKNTFRFTNFRLFIILLALPHIHTANIKDILNLNTDSLLSSPQDSTESLIRVPRENKYYLSRYGASSNDVARSIKPEESPEAREISGTPAAVGKRCIRCDSGYLDSRRGGYGGYGASGGYSGSGGYGGYGASGGYGGYGASGGYGGYEDRRRGYEDNRYDRYDDRYPERDRYSHRDTYDDRDRYQSRYSDRYDPYRSHERNRYDDYDRGYDRGYDRYDRNRGYDRYDRDRYNDRGVGYDNRGYDYREKYDRESYRPWDETYRGTSGFDGSGRGYYFASGRPDYGTSSGGYWGTGGGGGYASNYYYGGGGGRDDYRDRDHGSGYGGTASLAGNYYRPRDPYGDGGYRTTSYLYGRPSSTTTNRPSHSNDSDITQSPQQENTSG